jgi:chromosomal replication initiation ATPase DnaA
VAQNIIEFPFEPEFGSDNFIRCSSNTDAHQAIYNTILWPDKRLLILGEPGCGKSHLANIWAELNDAIHIREQSNPTSQAKIIENIEQIHNYNWLFHQINQAQQQEVPLLLTATHLPSYALLDLNSRINATYRVSIKDPSIELLKIILLKSLTDRQLKINAEVLDYLMVRINRSFEYVKLFVQHLDHASAEEKRSLTIPFVRKILTIGNLQN